MMNLLSYKIKSLLSNLTSDIRMMLGNYKKNLKVSRSSLRSNVMSLIDLAGRFRT